MGVHVYSHGQLIRNGLHFVSKLCQIIDSFPIMVWASLICLFITLYAQHVLNLLFLNYGVKLSTLASCVIYQAYVLYMYMCILSYHTCTCTVHIAREVWYHKCNCIYILCIVTMIEFCMLAIIL